MGSFSFFLTACDFASYCFNIHENNSSDKYYTNIGVDYTVLGDGNYGDGNYGQWFSTNLVLAEGQKVRISADGTVLLTAAYGYTTVSSDYEYEYANGGKGNYFKIDASNTAWSSITTLYKGQTVTFTLGECSTVNKLNRWDWGTNWQYKTETCVTKFGLCWKKGHSTTVGGPYTQSCSSHICDGSGGTGEWCGDGDEDTDTKIKCNASHTNCWNVDGNRLYALFDDGTNNGTTKHLKGGYEETLKLTSNIFMRIDNPLSSNNSTDSEVTSLAILQANYTSQLASLSTSIDAADSAVTSAKSSYSSELSILSANHTTYSSTIDLSTYPSNNNDFCTDLKDNYADISAALDSVDASASPGSTSAKSSMITDLATMNTECSNLISFSASYDTTNTSLESVNSQIDSYSTASSGDGAYEVYVKATPVTITNGANLEAIVVEEGDPNEAGTDVLTMNLGFAEVDYNVGEGVNVDLSNGGGEVIATSPGKGVLYLRIHDDDIYTDNSGSYNVRVDTVSEKSLFSSVINDIITMIKNQVTTITDNVYTALTCDNTGNRSIKCTDYVKTIKAILNLYIAFYAIGFMFGVIEAKQTDVITRLLKISIIVILINDNSWNFFKNDFFNFYLNGTNELISHATGRGVGTNNPFEFMDETVGQILFNPQILIVGVVFSFLSLHGIFYAVLILWGVWVFAKTVFETVTHYIMSIVIIGLLLSLAPIFIPFILFQKTVYIFEAWCGHLLKYMLEPVIIIVGLVFLFGMLTPLISEVLAHSYCLKCAMPITLSFPGVKWSGTLFCIPGFLPWGTDNNGDGMLTAMILQISEILSYVIIIKLMNHWVEMGSQLTSALTSQYLAPSTTNARSFQNTLGDLQGGQMPGLSSLFGIDEGSQKRRGYNKKIDAKARSEMNTSSSEPSGGGDSPAPSS